MGELFAEFGDLVFTLVIGYLSAIEFLYVVRHLYHHSFNHDAQQDDYTNDNDNLSQLQDSMRHQLSNAKSKEEIAGNHMMKDGVQYKDGFRLEAQQALIDQLKEQLKNHELTALKRQELEKELAKQTKIAQQLRKELEEAEAKYARQLKKEEEEKARKLLEEQQKREKEQRKLEEERAKKEAEEQRKRKEAEEHARKEAEESARKLEEAEKQRVAEQRKREEEAERARKEAEENALKAVQRKREEEEERARIEAEENARKLAEVEKQREEEQRKHEEAAENARKAEQRQREEEEERKRIETEENLRKLAEAEKQQREVEQRKREEEEERERKEAEENALKAVQLKREEEEAETARKLLEAEKQREAEERQREEDEERARVEAVENAFKLAEAEENERRILAAERQREEDQRQAEEDELKAQKLMAIEHRLEEQLRAAEQEAELTEKERRLIESIKKRDLPDEEANEQGEAELLKRILEAREQLGEESEEEQSRRLIERERDQETKQKRIEENTLMFLEAEKEMAELQAKMLEAVEKREYSTHLDSAPQTPIIEEPCIKRSVSPLVKKETTVKTQLAQDLDEPYTVNTKPLLFPGVSDDASSIDPASSQQSSFSTQPSEEIATGTDTQYPQQERQEPDGEDTAVSLQYSDDYLRSLDGIKQRPLIREDGSGRRRAFKKRRSSNSSNSSRESRHSRDEELKMFTSLEEEEMKNTADAEYTPIRYTSEPTLKVKTHRRHKRSPAKDKDGSLERLGEENNNPWGEVKPEHYKNTEFWKREKNLSIDEEMEFEKPASSEEVAYDTATNMPSASSFEEATQIQNEEALTALIKQSNKTTKELESEDKATAKEEPARSDNTNLQTSQTAEREASPARSSASPRLRRSPRIEEMDQYEERWIETNESTDKAAASTSTSAVNTPKIKVQTPLDFGPWRDEHGLMLQGLSDFYDFTASVNPSRSRNTSRNPSPAKTASNTPSPKNVSFDFKFSNKEEVSESTIEIYDDTEALENNEIKKATIIKFIDSLSGTEANLEEEETNIVLAEESQDTMQHHVQYLADDPANISSDQKSLVPLVNIIDDNASSSLEDNYAGNEDMNSLVSSLRAQRANSTSRSRSKSPLPTAHNLQRSLENRRYKMIKHNEDILEKLIETKLLPDLSISEETNEDANRKTAQNSTPESDKEKINANDHMDSKEQMDSLVQSLRVDRSRSRSKSPMRLPTAENLSKGLEKRRHKLIERNDEIVKQLEERSLTPESPRITVEHVYETESTEKMQETQTTYILNAPSIAIESPKTEPVTSAPMEEEDDCSREKMELLVQSLRVARSKSRSKSPMPNINIDYKRQDEHEEKIKIEQYTQSAPTISIEFAESEPIDKSNKEDDDCSREKMDLLVQSLRAARSRSRSKTPMRLPTAENLNKSLDSRRSKLIELNDELLQHVEERAKTPEPSRITLEYVYELESNEEVNQDNRSRHSRSQSPSRSHSMSPEYAEIDHAASRSRTPSRSISPHTEDLDDFHIMINLEGSQNKTLSISSEEQESFNLASRLRQLDEEALEKLKNASEEIELRTLSPSVVVLTQEELNETQSADYLADLSVTERSKLLRKSPTTPDYERTISEEMRDVERIKKEMLGKGFKRSTYVGESMDLGSEFESLRREAAHFQRSRTPSPSSSKIDNETALKDAEEKRQIQDLILQELTRSGSNNSNDAKETRKTGAIPKSERLSSCEIELTLTNEIEDTIKIKEEMLNSSLQTSSHLEQILDEAPDYEEMRRRNAEFRRSASRSRSPLRESQLQELAAIEAEATKRELQSTVLKDMSFQQFSRDLNPQFFDNDRRASDSALIQKPDILLQLQDSQDKELEPDEYHHFRRFSLDQEQPIEEYPVDDYIYIEEVEIRTRSGSRTWIREDFYSDDVEHFLTKNETPIKTSSEMEKSHEETLEAKSEEISSDNGQQDAENNAQAVDDEEEYSNASDDDRQTVVEVDDEIDEDISDFNERGLAEESHHETSECEEAEREMDRYAGREASDWNRIVDVEDIFIANEATNRENPISEDDEGAVGGLSNSNSPYDSDSFAIDQIYDEAIKNRKQSGILREYDSILMQMSSSDVDEQYLIWSKTQNKKKPKNIDFNTNFLDHERKDSEMRYLSDGNVTARQSARLRSRYGYNPVLQAKCLDDDVQVDFNYKPKREYNWRKNFKLDEENSHQDKEISKEDMDWEQNEIEQEQEELELNNNANIANTLNIRKYSLGGESITLFSRSPEKENVSEEQIELKEEIMEVSAKEIVEEVEVKEEKIEKPKKKKTKKKLRKESKGSLEETMNREDEAIYDTEVYNRRSSSIHMDTDSPKRKSHSRRNSTNEDNMGMFSPRSSVGYAEPIGDIMEEYMDMPKETARPKKMKKRKKVKEIMANVTESLDENKQDTEDPLNNNNNNISTISTNISPESSSANILSNLSPQNSVCVTPASSIENNDLINDAEELMEDVKDNTNSSTTTSSSPSVNISRTSSITTSVDTFDILKDASFYPLF